MKEIVSFDDGTSFVRDEDDPLVGKRGILVDRLDEGPGTVASVERWNTGEITLDMLFDSGWRVGGRRELFEFD